MNKDYEGSVYDIISFTTGLDQQRVKSDWAITRSLCKEGLAGSEEVER